MILRIFYLLVYLTTWTVGIRDCQTSDGYLRDHQDNATDNCDYKCGWMKCGDVCINAKEGKWCECGLTQLELYNGEFYCCLNPALDNSTQCSVLNDGTGFCLGGIIKSKTDTCNNHCYNDYETSAALGQQSGYHCGDHWCVRTWFMCQGNPLCPDSRDVNECDGDLRCIQYPGYRYKKGVLVSDLSSAHHYCDYEGYHNDGQYHTITREDESDLDILSIKVDINYSSITRCHTDSGNPGLMCGELCLLYMTWCREDRVNLCGNFSTNNNKLCSNTTFWAGQTCDIFFSSGKKATSGVRCTGSTQQCTYPWYKSTSAIYNYKVLKHLRKNEI